MFLRLFRLATWILRSFLAGEFRSMFREHLATGLPRTEAFVIFIFFGDVTALVEVTPLLTADNHSDGAFTDGKLGVNFIRLYQVDLSRADEHITRFANLGVVRLRAVIEPVIADDSFASVEHAVKSVDVCMIVNACALTMPGVSLGEPVNRKAVIGIFVKQ